MVPLAPAARLHRPLAQSMTPRSRNLRGGGPGQEQLPRPGFLFELPSYMAVGLFPLPPTGRS
eukprot:7487610-Alexandrium_andersonii.AAC.1